MISSRVGESEKNLTAFFESATKHAPAIIFIDEIDSIGAKRGSSSESWKDGLLNHLLQLIDGVIESHGLYIIAATNREHLVDEALKRPGRLNKVIHLELPGPEERERIFSIHLKNLPLVPLLPILPNYLRLPRVVREPL